MKLEFFISKRYLLNNGKSRNLLSLISLFALISIFLGVLLPTLIMSVFSGFQKEIREKILGVQGHISLRARDNLYITNYQNIVRQVEMFPQVLSASPYIEVQGMAQFYQELKPILIKGVPPNLFHKDKELGNLVQVVEGKKNLVRKYQMLVGSDLAKSYFLSPGDRLTLLTVRDNLSLNTTPINIKGQVQGVFKTGYYEMDDSMVYTSLNTLQSAFGVGNRVNGIDLKVNNVWKTKPLLRDLRQLYGDKVVVYSWEQKNANLFKALRTERVMMWIIMTLILVVAIFNVMSSQVMLVIDKKREIGILKTIGVKPLQIQNIFLLEGLMVTGTSGLLGVVCGNLLARYLKQVLGAIEWTINTFNSLLFNLYGWLPNNPDKPEAFYFFPKEVYYFETLPVDLDFGRSAMILGFVLCLSIVAGLLPSSQAAKMRPLEVMRYE